MKRKIALSTLWGMFASGVPQLGQLLAAGIMGRLTNSETVGGYMILMSTLVFASNITSLGTSTSITKYVARLSSDTRRLEGVIEYALRIVLLTSTLIATIFIFVGKEISEWLIGNYELVESINVLSFAIVLITVDNFSKSILNGYVEMKKLAISSIVSTVVGVIILLVLANSYGLYGVSIGILAWTAAGSLVSSYFAFSILKSSNIRINILRKAKERKIVHAYIIPTLLTSLLVFGSFWGVQRTLANGINGLLEVAVFGICLQWFNIISYIPNVCGRVILPHLSKLCASSSTSEINNVMKYAIVSNMSVSLPLFIVVYFASNILSKLYSIGDAGALSDSIVLVCIAGLITTFATPFGSLLIAKSALWIGVILNLIWAIVFLTATSINLDLGAKGACIALLIAYSVHGITAALSAAIVKSNDKK